MVHRLNIFIGKVTVKSELSEVNISAFLTSLFDKLKYVAFFAFDLINLVYKHTPATGEKKKKKKKNCISPDKH